MKKIPSFFFLLFLNLPISAQIHIWPTIDPYIPYHSVEYYENVKGYSKSVKASIIERNKDVYTDALDKFDIKLRKLYTSACPGVGLSNTVAPMDDMSKSSDIFVDLSCGLSILNNDYPYYRFNNLNLSPEVYYLVKIFNTSGAVVAEKKFTEIIDYRKSIKSELGSVSQHEYDAEIFHQALLKSFESEGIKNALTYICSFYSEMDKTETKPDPDKFKQSLSLVLEQRVSEYPGYYKYFTLGAGGSNSGSGPTSSSTASYSPAGNYVDNNNIPSAETPSVSPEMVEIFNAVREQSKNYALIIAENEYQSPDVNDLNEPINDARKLTYTLLTRYDFYESEMIFLENPTRAEIIAALDLLSGTVGPLDNLLIFYSGHGHWDETLEKGYWIPSDATLKNRVNWFSNSELRDYIHGIKSHHTLLIADACFSGGIFKTRDAFNEVSPATYQLYKLPSRKAMTAGAMTTVPDKSVFFFYLINRLTENQLPYLTAEQLFASFKIAVINNSPANQVPQFGEIREAGDEGGDFLFILK
ncbi:MAG: caspase family protein [Bacteroidales bacterium]|nr:caspase family protein [Bacteroidales bacterium]